jgi:hypothetical protein
MSLSALIAIVPLALQLATMDRTADGPAAVPRPTASPSVIMSTLLEKTIFRVDVLQLEVWLGPRTARRLAPLLPVAPGTTAADSAASIAIHGRDAWARLVFRRDIGLDRFLKGVRRNLERARRAGIVDDGTYQAVSSGLPRWFAPLAERGIEDGDRLFYRIREDTLRTVFQERDGRIAIDQTDVGAGRRLTVLGGFLVEGSDFRRGLIASLPSFIAGGQGSIGPAADLDRTR